MFSANSSQVSDDKLFVEDVFSTYLYDGTSASLTINNGIDLAGKGGLVWLKNRTQNLGHVLLDTARGANYYFRTNTTGASSFSSAINWSFNSNGFSQNNAFTEFNAGYPYASWTFRKAPKFFDVVTYTGNGTNRTIAHNLGVVPGMILVKRTDVAADWQVYHRSNANTQYMVLNTTAAVATGTTRWNSTTPTATEFTVGTDTTVNANGGTYVAYLFAHDATSDGIIQCGSFTTDGSGNASVTLGWEPQWILRKPVDTGGGSWYLFDAMRGLCATNTAATGLFPNATTADDSGWPTYINSTGFTTSGQAANSTHIYIAIRRGPMRTPTSGTSVFSPNLYTQPQGTQITTGFPVDFEMYRNPGSGMSTFTVDRLRGVNTTNTDPASPFLYTNSTGAEASVTGVTQGWNNTGFQVTGGNTNFQIISWAFRRAPSFFDEVCYTGTGVAGRTVSHNLGVAPELMIVKIRSTTGNWPVYSASLGNTKYLYLNSSGTGGTFSTWNNTSPTASVFSLGSDVEVNNSGATYVAYLFASCPGVSKVGSYTGNGSSQTINCGFAAGARFVMIKRTNAAGDWYVWDSARGIVAGNDPRLSLNSTAAEVTTDDSVDTDSSGFVVNQLSATNINVSSATYIYLAVA